MRLLVVAGSPPKSSFSWPFQRISAPQPPGPGLPLHAPSVQISIVSVMPREVARFAGSGGRAAEPAEDEGRAADQNGAPHSAPAQVGFALRDALVREASNRQAE